MSYFNESLTPDLQEAIENPVLKPEDLPIGSYPPFGYGCGCFQSKAEPYRDDCYWFSEEQDMNARVPMCAKSKEYSIELCPKDCENYISNKRASELVDKYLEGRNYGCMATGETKD